MRKNVAEYLAAAAIAASPLVAAPLAAQDNSELFTKLDANKDGFVTADEVPENSKALYERMLRTSDKDGDKKLSKDEFQAGLKPDETPRQPLPGGGAGFPMAKGGKGDPREFFKQLDANKDGKITKDEMPERMRDNFARMDANGDGSVSAEEFAQIGRQFGGKAPPGAPQPGGAPPQGRPNAGGAMSRSDVEALFDRTDSNSDGKLTKDEIPEERPGMRGILERSGGTSIDKEQFVRGMMAMMAQVGGQQPRPEGAAPRPEGARPDATGQRPEGAPSRPDSQPGNPPGGLPPGMRFFGAIDLDRNGELSTSEIVGAGTALLKLDRNGDGKITVEEALGSGPGGPPPGGMRGRPGDGQPGVGQPGNGLPGTPQGQRRPGQRGFGGMNPDELRQQLKAADANNDGKISKDEAPGMIKERFDRIDTNSDGVIDEAEIGQMIRRMAEGAK
jgi:Ca2+-binding EF-hand superfamily protein